MPTGSSFGRLLAVATLPRSRELLRNFRGGWLLAATIALVYGLVSMVVGLMLELGPTDFTTTTATLSTSPWPGIGPWWDFPLVIITAPNAVITLPFFPTLSMVLVSVGVGLGMGVAVVLTVRLLRNRRTTAGRPAGMGAVAGLTPAMIALVTLGACCSTTAAATAGIGLAAQASGTTFGALTVNTWYLGVFQMVILGAALIAQEQLAEVYGFVLDPARAREAVAVPPVNLRYLGSGALRIGLFAAAVTWGLALVAEWTLSPPPLTSGAAWFSGVFLHLLPAFVAAIAALSPGTLSRAFGAPRHRRATLLFRIALGIGAVALLGWFPASLVAAGAHGLVNELLATVGASAAAGAAPVPGVTGIALGLRWAFQYVLLGGFALALALAPTRVSDYLVGDPGTARAFRPEPGPAAPGRGVGAAPSEER